MNNYEQKEVRSALFTWRSQTLLGLFKPWLVLTPLAIINRINDIPHTTAYFKYKEVFVFGVRIMRVQVD